MLDYAYSRDDPRSFLQRAYNHLWDDEEFLMAHDRRGRLYPLDPQAVRALRAAREILMNCIVALTAVEDERRARLLPNVFLRRYVQVGLSRIVSLRYRAPHLVDGIGDADETVVAYADDGRFVRVPAQQRVLHYWNGRHVSLEVGPMETITQQDYEALAVGNPVVDTPDALRRAHAEIARSQRFDFAVVRFSKYAPACSRCGMQLLPRQSRRGPFWGCPNYPHCEGKAAMTPEIKSQFS